MHRHRVRMIGRAAALARRAPAAVVAQQHRRISATIAEDEHLSAGFDGRAHLREQLRRQACIERALAHVQHAHARRFRIARALGQTHVRESPGLRVVQRFQRRRGAAEHHRHAERLAADQREVARVVADAVLLFVTAVVFFVDDEQSRFGQRREHRRARTDDDARFAACGGGPHAGARGVVEPRMQGMHFDAQPRAESRERLRRQSDLRHEHERLPPAREAIGDRLQIDLGLAAAGDAFEQHRAETVVRDDRLDRGALFVVERRPGRAAACDARGLRPERFGQAFRSTARARRCASRAGRRRVRPRCAHAAASSIASRCGIASRLSLSSDAPSTSAPHDLIGFGQRSALAQGGRQRRRQHFAERRMRVAREPTQRFEQFAVQHRIGVEDGERRLGFARARIDRTDARDDTDEFARTERHAHARAHLHAVDRHALGRAIVEQSSQRQPARPHAGRCRRRTSRAV